MLIPYAYDKNVVTLNNEEDKTQLIDLIKREDFVPDKEFKEFLEKNFPISTRIEKVPIPMEQVKSILNEIFHDLPDSVFESENIVDIMKRTINEVIRKKETEFLIINISNSKLRYYPQYRYKRAYEFYYEAIRLIFMLEEYYTIFINTFIVFERIFLQSFEFNDKNLTRLEMDVFREGINTIGRGLLRLQKRLNKINNDITVETRWVKRTTVPIPKDYFENQDKLKSITENYLNDIEKRIEKLIDRKKKVNEYYRKNRGILTKENLRFLRQLVLEGLI